MSASKGARKARRKSIPLALALSAAMLLPGGCGYHTAGRGTRIPEQIAVIAIPTFTNQTQSYRAEQVLTGAVVREFLSRTKYKIVNREDPSADAILKGAVTLVQSAPVTYDSRTGRASSAVIYVNMGVSLVDRNGRTIYENPSYSFREQYQVSREITSFFEEESPAVERLARDFAHTLVSDILESY